MFWNDPTLYSAAFPPRDIPLPGSIASPFFMPWQGFPQLAWQGAPQLPWQGVPQLPLQGIQQFPWQGIQQFPWQGIPQVPRFNIPTPGITNPFVNYLPPTVNPYFPVTAFHPFMQQLGVTPQLSGWVRPLAC